jgi:hypothetical protein
MARRLGLEPRTDGLENRCSIRLSYRRLKLVADGITVLQCIDKGKAHAQGFHNGHLPIVFRAF